MTSSGFPLHSDQNPSHSQVAGWRCSPVCPGSPRLAYSSSIVIISVSSTPPVFWQSFPPQNMSYVVTLQMRPNVFPHSTPIATTSGAFQILKDTKPFPAWRPSSTLPNLSQDDSNQSSRPQFDFTSLKTCVWIFRNEMLPSTPFFSLIASCSLLS